MQEFVGKVVSNKMTKSVTVAVTRLLKREGKYKDSPVRLTRKFMAHDEANECNIGDLVKIHSCRPLSKNKFFTVTDVLQKAKIFDAQAAAMPKAHTPLTGTA